MNCSATYLTPLAFCYQAANLILATVKSAERERDEIGVKCLLCKVERLSTHLFFQVHVPTLLFADVDVDASR